MTNGLANAQAIELPSNRAFVLQFASGASAANLFQGRAEHLASGRVARFQSLADLAWFLESVLSSPTSDNESEVPGAPSANRQPPGQEPS